MSSFSSPRSRRDSSFNAVDISAPRPTAAKLTVRVVGSNRGRADSETTKTSEKDCGPGWLRGTVSGLPSTLFSLWRGDDPLAASKAAGQLLGKPTLTRALAAHLVVSLGWGVVLSQLLGRRHLRTSATLAGGVIAALDLGLIGRRIPAIRRVRGRAPDGRSLGLRTDRRSGVGSTRRHESDCARLNWLG